VRRYHTLCGAVEVRRDSYRRVGVHNGPTVVPLEIAAGIVENATPALAASVLEGFTMMPLRDYEDEMRAAHRVIPSRSTLERIAKRTGAALHAELPMIEPVVRARETVPKKAHVFSLGLDRTTVPMAEMPDDIRLPATPAHVRRRLPPVTVAYRMAYVATVAVHDRRGETLKSTRIAAAAHEGANELMERVGAELHHLLGQRPRATDRRRPGWRAGAMKPRGRVAGELPHPTQDAADRPLSRRRAPRSVSRGGGA
jgi:hypothetical protein